ncbi:MAG: YhbY family RNA-binding protein [Azoarcus sp.]|nr:YhbY family RNA-binding protein [Azoarcus sp.]
MSKIELSPAERRDLRARAHAIDPVVTVAGNGLAPTVLAEIERSLQAHELIKVRTQGIERAEREALLIELCDKLDAAPVQRIGNILIVWRPRKEVSRPITEKPAIAKSATGKSAAAFAAAARRAALARAAAKKKPEEKRKHWFGQKPAGRGR